MKTELDPNFDYDDKSEFVKFQNENIILCFVFSIPFVGWLLLALILLYEIISRWAKITRIFVKRILLYVRTLTKN